MSAAGCARAASDLTALVHRLDRARQALFRQSRFPEDDFDGLSGDAYRRHAAQSAVTVAGAASDLALLAGALAALGRELAAAEEIRDQAAGSPPERARELRLRARDLERHAQQRWRAAVADYEGRPGPAPEPVRPIVPGTVMESSPGSTPEPVAPAPVAAAAVAPPAETDPAAAPELDSALVVPPPALESELVVPPRALESELVVPPFEPAGCGPTEGE